MKSLDEEGNDRPVFLHSKSKSFDFDSVKITKDEEVQRLNSENEHLRIKLTMLRDEMLDTSGNNDLQTLKDILTTKEAIIAELSEQNDGLTQQIASISEGGVEILDQSKVISELRLDCVKHEKEIERLKAIENSSKQTKQVLKDTTWTLRVKEEELKKIKADMRENYEKRLNELMQHLNDRDYKLSSLQQENNALIESESDHILRVW